MIEFEINAEFAKDVEVVLASKQFRSFEPIRESGAKILTAVCIRTDKTGEHQPAKGTPIICKKLPPLYQLLMQAQYIVVADYYYWTHADSRKVAGSIHSALASIDIEKDDKGEYKYKTRKPDIREHRVTVENFGPYTEDLKDFSVAMDAGAKLFAENMIAKE